MGSTKTKQMLFQKNGTEIKALHNLQVKFQMQMYLYTMKQRNRIKLPPILVPQFLVTSGFITQASCSVLEMQLWDFPPFVLIARISC